MKRIKPKVLELSQVHARKLLLDLMSKQSEERCAASWQVGMEFLLWEDVLKRSGPGLFPYERAALRALAALAGGWWMWSGRKRFVPMARWLAIYRRHQAEAARRLDTLDSSLNDKAPREILAAATVASAVAYARLCGFRIAPHPLPKRPHRRNNRS
jgi:hypothetical protein